MVVIRAGKNTFEQPETIGTAENLQGQGTVQDGKGFDKMASPEPTKQTGPPDIDESEVERIVVPAEEDVFRR